MIKAAKTYLFTLIPFISRRWGPKPVYTKWVYTTIIRPRILYAYFTWGHMVGQGKRREALGSINKLAAKMIVPIRHTTPRHSLEVIFDLIPLDIQGTYEALASLTRQELALTQTWIGTNPKYSTYIGHRRYWYDLRNEMLGHSARLSDREKGILTNKNYTVDTKSMNNRTPPNTHTNQHLH